ncbi:hypothetical protein PHYSODRAFT_245887, partial [Phytophthora sojae]
VVVKFKPQLKLSGTCHPYPAVDTNGDINAGMKPSWGIFDRCDGSDLGYGMGHSNVWEYAIIWIDNPDLESPTIKSVTLQSDEDTTEKHAPVDSKYIDGTSFRVNFAYGDNETGRLPGSDYLGATPRRGEDSSEQHFRLFTTVR